MPLPNVPANLVPANEATLIRRIEDLERQQRETLPAIMSAIAPMFADINQTIEQVQAQVLRIDALVNSQVLPREFSGHAAGWSVPSSTWTAVASASLTVPAGFTQAIVSAIGWWRIGVGTTAVTAYLNGRVVVGGELGDSASVRVEVGDGGSIQGASVEALDGLIPGSTITVSSDAYMSTEIAASGPNSARVSGVVLWLR